MALCATVVAEKTPNTQQGDIPMTNKFAGTQTEKNLWAAFAGESQARNKYDYFAGVARKEGYQQIAELFDETAANERQHAKIWFKHLQGIGNTAENLKAAASGENYEWTDMYEGFAQTRLLQLFLHICHPYGIRIVPNCGPGSHTITRQYLTNRLSQLCAHIVGHQQKQQKAE